MQTALQGKHAERAKTLTKQVYDILGKRYPDFYSYGPGERTLLVASVLVNDIKLREKTRNNSKELEEMREVCQGTTRDMGAVPWCAVFITYCGLIAGNPVMQIMADRGAMFAVRSWEQMSWNESRNKRKPRRGDLCYFLHPNGTGHIGIVAGIDAKTGNIISYEGNTSSGISGSQRDGDGAYRRSRSGEIWDGYINIDDK